jgi:hypothetical protein
MICGGCTWAATVAHRGVDMDVEVQVDLQHRRVAVNSAVLAQALRASEFGGQGLIT